MTLERLGDAACPRRSAGARGDAEAAVLARRGTSRASRRAVPPFGRRVVGAAAVVEKAVPTPLSERVEAYRRVRLAEGLASEDPAYAVALPFRDLSGRNGGLWRVRALHYLAIRACLAAVPWVGRVLDLGAGNGWMARRLARRYQVAAADLDGRGTGLGALAGTPVLPVRAEMPRLPFASGSFDAVVAAAALHHAGDVATVLAEVARVLGRRGIVVIADSPVYEDAMARQQAARRTQRYYRDMGEPGLAADYRGLLRAELERPGLFRFVTLMPGMSLRGTLRSLFGGGGPGAARLPVLVGWRRR
jgi:SAM-dependent methyltransferase